MRCSTILLAAFCAAACAELDEPTGEGYRDLPADWIMIGVRHAPTQDGIRQALGVFDTVYVYNDSSVYHLRGVELEIFSEEGRERAKVTSERGRLNTATDAMVAIGNVVLMTPEGTRIETEELHYDPVAHRIWSDVTTRRIDADGEEFIADSFTADDEFDTIHYERPRGRLRGANIRF